MFILVVFLLLLKCAKRKAKFYFIPIQKKKPREVVNYLEIFSFVQYQCLYFYSNTSYVIINLLIQAIKSQKTEIQIHLMLLLIFIALSDTFSNLYSNTSYVIINLKKILLKRENFLNSNTSYVIINLNKKTYDWWKSTIQIHLMLLLIVKTAPILSLPDEFKYILCYY